MLLCAKKALRSAWKQGVCSCVHDMLASMGRRAQGGPRRRGQARRQAPGVGRLPLRPGAVAGRVARGLQQARAARPRPERLRPGLRLPSGGQLREQELMQRALLLRGPVRAHALQAAAAVLLPQL